MNVDLLLLKAEIEKEIAGMYAEIGEIQKRVKRLLERAARDERQMDMFAS